jgi:uncharacterized protein (TIGR00375 family)
MAECESILAKTDESGLYPVKTAGGVSFPLRFMVTGEVDAEFHVRDQSKRVHLLIFCPSLETSRQVSDVVSKYGDLASDGRPKLHVAPPELVERVMEVDPWNEVVPAHVWTPWFSLFGSKSGFDRIEDCFQDQTRNIHALETGLSSDPAMNWRLSGLDRFTLISNSDSHSPWPYRIGREANVFDLKRLTYKEIVDAIRKKDPTRFLETIETDPCYGKYHYTGHRTCNIVLNPKESSKCQKVCPVCGRELTVGVLDRVEELADREEGFRPEGAIPYVKLIPLQEIISIALGVKEIFAKVVWEEYNKLLRSFRNEFDVLLNVPSSDISAVSGERISQAILRVRENKIRFRPGYDGVYGHPIIYEDDENSSEHISQAERQGPQKEKKRGSETKEKERQYNQSDLSGYFWLM